MVIEFVMKADDFVYPPGVVIETKPFASDGIVLREFSIKESQVEAIIIAYSKEIKRLKNQMNSKPQQAGVKRMIGNSRTITGNVFGGGYGD